MSADEERAELAAEKRAAKQGRWDFLRSPLSAFVRTMRAVMTQYLEARSNGVSREDGIKGIEEELRAAWPKSVSKFKPFCDGCDDTGWREMFCWERQRCGREVCAANPEKQHAYVVICDCTAGDRKRGRLSANPEDQLAAVGRRKKAKPTGWSQVGR